MADSRQHPVASYRLQLTPSFGFNAVTELIEHLARLGVSHLYLSPIAEAVPGSEHGYDVVDHRSVRTDFGGRNGLVELLDAVEDAGLAAIIDHVPNHVSVARAELNPPWWAMLRDGPSSDAARWFDVDWSLTDGRVIIPKLGDPLDDVIAAGQLSIDTNGDDPVLRYGPLVFPLARGTEDLDVREAVDAQHYRLTWWRTPERNVRRFFTIDDLVAVRVEDPGVAEVVDTIVDDLLNHPAFDGVRIDHVDGLADPGAYLRDLRDKIGDRWLLVEKILAPLETLPSDWPVDGTTGYEHIRNAEHVLLDPNALAPLDRLWSERSGRAITFDELEVSSRREVLDGSLSPDLDRLVRTAESVAASDDEGPTGTTPDRQAFVELTLGLDRYRTYLSGASPSGSDEASRYELDEATATATSRAPDRGEAINDATELVIADRDVQVRWQQLTGPVMAKGAEDRAFYRYHRLSSLCEVGGAPGRWTFDTADFHAHQIDVQARWPATMLADTTHDTKRSGGVRARSLALAAHGDEWADFVRTWSEQHPQADEALDAGDLMLALQTAATAAPLDAKRLTDYLVKAAREADLRTTWTDPDHDYERTLATLAASLLDDHAVSSWQARLDRPGAAIGLRLLVLQLTCPGIADLYQGAPMELLSLVDPDNRRPPAWSDWSASIDRATDVDAKSGHLAGDTDLARTALTQRLLHLRRRRPGAFDADAGYQALDVTGPRQDDVIAFSRTDAEQPAVVTVTIRALGGDVDWSATNVEVLSGSWRSLLENDAPILTGGPTPLTTLLGEPVDDPGVVVLERTDR